MAEHDRRSLLIITLSATLITINGQAIAETWRVLPSISVDEKWTDNAFSSSSDKKADWITTVKPGISINGNGKRLNLGVDYSLAYDRYAAQDSLDGLRHQGLVSANAEVVEETLFLDARGAVHEQVINPTAAVTAGDRTAASNRTRVASYSLGPTLRHRFGPWASGQLRYRHDETKYLSASGGSNAAGGNLPDSAGDTARLTVRSGEEFDRMLWQYDADGSHSSGGADLTQTSNTATGEFRLDREWGVLSHVGYDSLSGAGVDSDRLGGVFYGAGLHWTPSPRSDVRAQVGRRYDQLDLMLTGTQAVGAYTSLNLSHSTGITTESENIANALDALSRDEQGRFFDPFTGLAADPTVSPFQRGGGAFRQSVSSAALTHRQDRDSVTLVSSLSTRDEGATSGKTSAVDAGLTWTHALSEEISSSAGLGHSSVVDAPTEAAKVDRLRANVSLNAMLNPTLSAHAGYWFVDSQPKRSAGVTENMVMVGMSKMF